MRKSIAISAFSAIFASQAALAQSDTSASKHPYFNNTHALKFGAAYQEFDAQFRATHDGLPPLTLDIDTLGIDDTDYSWMAGYRWRFADR